MKELYTRPELEIEAFVTEDIITTSDNEGSWNDQWNLNNANVENDGR